MGGENCKKMKASLFVFLLWVILIYLCGSFIALSFNILVWPVWLRFVGIVAVFIGLIASAQSN